MKWIAGRYGWLVPLIALLLVLAGTFVVDQERGGRMDARERTLQAAAQRRAAMLADQVGNALAVRIGALTAARLRFTEVRDSVSVRLFDAALDSVTSRIEGLQSIQVIVPGAHLQPAQHAPPIARQLLTDSALGKPFARALATGRPTATGALDAGGRRMIVFDPVPAPGAPRGQAVLAAELDPLAIVREAVPGTSDGLRGTFYAIYASNGPRLTSDILPRGWPAVQLPVRVADRQWFVRVAYPPPDLRAFHAARIATWAVGLIMALLLALVLTLFRRTIAVQRSELARREAMELAARTAAADARERAHEARALAAQLEAAQRAAQRLSTSLDPDDVVELFLGGVAETLGAEVATLYTFAEEGEVVVGRKRMVLNEAAPGVERLRSEDITQVRVPVAMLPVLAEVVSSGEPYVVEDAARDPRPLGVTSTREPGAATPVASVTVPLSIGRHVVGLACWDVYSGPRHFDAGKIAFAQALAAPATAALRTAELFASLEAARAGAAWEALRFGAVLDQMADGVIVVDVRGRVELSNQAAVELLGPEIASVALEEWPARFQMTASDGRPLARALAGERVRRASFTVRARGSDRYLSCSASPILTRAGEAAGAAMVLRDVSDEQQYAALLRHTNRELRRQAEALEQVNRQLRDATRAKDQFLAVMSHELRTPINAVMGYADLLDLEVKGRLNEEQKTMIARIRETSRHLLGLINEVLDLAKIGSGRIQLTLEDLDLARVVESAVRQVLPPAAAKGLTLRVRAPQERVTVVADETRLAQIVLNLLSNAVKFTQRGGVTVAFARMGERVVIRVRDTGPGIRAEQRERIFEEFYQVEGGLSRSVGGSGLGLAIARRFARLMNGDITVESEPGKGSEFVVDLPAMPAGGGSTPTLEPVVVVAGDKHDLGVLSAELRGLARVIGSPEPAQVAALVRRDRAQPTLLVVDGAAPQARAWRTISALVAGGDPMRAPILLAADGGEGDVVDLGILAPLTTPVSIQQTVQVVERAAGRHRLDRVLVAEDDGDVRSIVAEALFAGGYRVDTAVDASEALTRLAALPSGLLVLNLLLPGEGITVLARMRADATLRDTPVVALLPAEMSAEEMARLEESCRAAAVDSTARRATLAELVREAVGASATAVLRA